jgi:hypothetical protein
MRLLALLPATLALLAACASMSDDQCRRADWLEQGRRDGRAGESPYRIDAHAKACGKLGITPDAQRWQAGWREGVVAYCTPQVAWALGARNGSYEGACRDRDEAMFQRWQRSGQDLFRTRQQRDTNRTEINKLEEQLKKASTDEERKVIRDKIRQIDSEQARLRRLIDTLESAAPK